MICTSMEELDKFISNEDDSVDIVAVASFTAYKVHMNNMNHIGEGQVLDGMDELCELEVNELSETALEKIVECMDNQKS